MRFRHAIDSPVGELSLFAEGDTVAGVYFENHSPAPKNPNGRVDAGPFAELVEQLKQYFAGERSSFDVPICLTDGTPFQQQIWQQLTEIPHGSTVTYMHLAKSCDRPKAVRAVGAAVGRNPLSIVVPCHRVIGTNGKLTGFAGGVQRKQWLLDHEKQVESCLLK